MRYKFWAVQENGLKLTAMNDEHPGRPPIPVFQNCPRHLSVITATVLIAEARLIKRGGGGNDGFTCTFYLLIKRKLCRH